MTYTETLDRLATSIEEQVLAAYRSWQDDQITREEFLAVAVAFLAAAVNRGTALADAALAAYLSAATGTAVPALGLTPPTGDHRADLEEAATHPEDPEARTASTARAVTLAAAQDAYGRGMRERGVNAWTRVLNSGACELCQDLAGDVLPGTAEMYHHKGCGCTQRPILDN